MGNTYLHSHRLRLTLKIWGKKLLKDPPGSVRKSRLSIFKQEKKNHDLLFFRPSLKPFILLPSSSKGDEKRFNKRRPAVSLADLMKALSQIPQKPKWCNRCIIHLCRPPISCDSVDGISLCSCETSPGDQGGNSMLESPRSWTWIRPVVKTQNSRWISAEAVRRGAWRCKVERRERAKGACYLRGNLGRQEIETPCCEDLKQREQSKLNQDCVKVHCTATLPVGWRNWSQEFPWQWWEEK